MSTRPRIAVDRSQAESDHALPAGSRPRDLLWAALIVMATFIAYSPALSAGFIWNDSDYVTAPELRSLGGLARIWFEVGATEQYYPVLHSAFWVQQLAWGDAAAGYHVSNILLHAAAAVLLGAVLRRLAAPGAWLAAAIFALHPVMAESVAWISEQKNTLSTVFSLAAALVYLRFDARRDRASYIAATIWFALALLSKSVAATLPAALLVAFWWRRGRLEWRRDVRPLAPWFVAAAVFGVFSAWVEREHIGARGAAFDLSLLERVLVAGRVVWFYLGKLLWPAELMFIYPRWQVNAADWRQILFPFATMALLAGAWALRRRNRAPLAALLFFAGCLFPVSGLFNVYGMKFSYVADHWQYVPAIGVIALAAGAFTTWIRRLSTPRAQTIAWCSAGAVVALLGALTFRETRQYADAETLYRSTIARNPAAWMPHFNLGNLLRETGRDAEALAHFEAAWRAQPDLAPAAVALGKLCSDLGRDAEAVRYLQQATELEPDSAEWRITLADVLAAAGRIADARAELDRVLARDPSHAGALLNLGVLFASSGQPAEAIAQFRAALAAQPRLIEARANLGAALLELGQRREAIDELRRAVDEDPGYLNARRNLAVALAQDGRTAEAVAQFRELTRLEPDSVEAHFNLAVLLRELGRTEEAWQHYQRAQEIEARVRR